MVTTMRLAIVLLVIAVFGCSVTPKTHVVENQPNTDYMPFIRDRITERQEVLARLGEPASTYEGDRIVTYWLQMDEADTLQVVPVRSMPKNKFGSITREVGLHNLVLVFDSDGVLARHSFVLIR